MSKVLKRRAKRAKPPCSVSVLENLSLDDHVAMKEAGLSDAAVLRGWAEREGSDFAKADFRQKIDRDRPSTAHLTSPHPTPPSQF